MSRQNLLLSIKLKKSKDQRVKGVWRCYFNLEWFSWKHDIRRDTWKGGKLHTWDVEDHFKYKELQDQKWKGRTKLVNQGQGGQ